MTLATGEQLAQRRDNDTTAHSAFTATLRTEVTRIVVCNTTGTAATASVFHDDDGAVFDQTTALRYAQSVPANTSIEILTGGPGGGITVKPSGQIGVQSGTANALTFTIYGATERRSV